MHSFMLLQNGYCSSLKVRYLAQEFVLPPRNAYIAKFFSCEFKKESTNISLGVYYLHNYVTLSVACE